MYPPHHYGGYELSCRDVVDCWRASGHDVTVLTSRMRIDGVADPADERGTGVRRDLHIAYRDGDLHAPPLRQRLPRERDNQRVLKDTLRDIAPDVVSVWGMGAMSTGLLTTLARTGVPLVYVMCDDWLTYAHKVDPWMRLFARSRRLAARVERIVGVPTTLPDVGRSGVFCWISQLTRDRSIKYSPWFFPESTVTYNGIDHRDFPVADAAPGHAWRWRMVIAGRLDPRKGMETAVRALAHLPPDARLELLPSVDDPYRAHLEAVARELGVADRLTVSYVSRRELRDAYLDADVFVFPTEWDEPFGLVPLEAMACGIPVVATGAGGSGEFLIDGDNCVRFAAGDPVELAEAVRRLADDSALRARVIDGGFRSARELSIGNLAATLEGWHLAASQHFAHGRPHHRVLESR